MKNETYLKHTENRIRDFKIWQYNSGYNELEVQNMTFDGSFE